MEIGLCRHVVVIWIGRPHILLTLHSIQQGSSFLADASLLFCPVVPFLLHEFLAKFLLSSKLVLAEENIDSRRLFLLLETVDIDVDGGHAIRGRRIVAETGSAIIMSVFVLSIFFLRLETVFLPCWECAEALFSIKVGRMLSLVMQEG